MTATSTTTGNGSRKRLTGRNLAWIVIALVLAGALTVIVVGALMAPDRQHDMWVELVSRASQLIVLALAGGVVGAVIHDRDAAREDARRRQAFLLAFIDELESAFGQVKSARRMLRTLGFDTPRATRLTSEQVTGFRTQLATLNDSELQFETLARRVQAVPRPFGGAHAGIAAELAAVHAYLNTVLRDWQSDPTAIAEDSTTAALAGWPSFAPFVGYGEAAEQSYREGVVDHILAIELLIRDLGGEG